MVRRHQPGLDENFYSEEWQEVGVGQLVRPAMNYLMARARGSAAHSLTRQNAPDWPVFDPCAEFRSGAVGAEEPKQARG